MGIFYKDKPLFGLDIGRSSVKIMQIDQEGKKPRVTGYGSVSFDKSIIDDQGIVQKPNELVEHIYKLISNQLVGRLTTDRVAVSIPNTNSFSRVLSLPKMTAKDMNIAIEAEVSQSIPHPIENLYFDHSVVRVFDDGMQEVQVIATPRDLIDSYMNIFSSLNLEVALIESNIASMTRIVVQSEAHDTTTLIVDIGSTACDISIYDGSAIRATGTVDCSSERLTKTIAEKLGISDEQAHSIKTRYGLEKSKKQAEITEAADTELKKLIIEIRKVIRYFTDRNNDDTAPVGQIIILGGGANLPGLAGYITEKTRVATRLCSPWNNLEFGKLQPPHELETTLYTTASGLALVKPQELAK